MSDTDYDIPTHSYWPSVTDLFLTLFIIAIAIVAVVFYILLPTNNVGLDRTLVNAVGNDLSRVRKPMNHLRETLELESIGGNVRPPEVIKALDETCATGVTQIEFLKSRIKELQDQLARLMETKDQKAEMERLLKENETLKRQLESLQQMTKIGDPQTITKVIRENEELRLENNNLTKQLHDKPPNIRFSEERQEYRFESGKSVMGPEFIRGLSENEFVELATQIIERQVEGRIQVDTLEIIGHTDGEAVRRRKGNLDDRLPEILAGKRADISSLSPGSNNDLGLLRALAVKNQWINYVENHPSRDILERIDVRCYSAGQTIPPHHVTEPGVTEFRKSDPSARRIEMRLTRLGD